jgi:hypothetical protein
LDSFLFWKKAKIVSKLKKNHFCQFNLENVNLNVQKMFLYTTLKANMPPIFHFTTYLSPPPPSSSVGSARGSIASMNSGGGGGGVQTPRSAGEGGRVGYIKKAAAGKPRKHVAAKLEMSLEASPLAATSTAEPGGGGRCPSPAANGGGADFRGGYRRPSSGSSSQQRPLTPLPMAKRRTPLITMSRSQCSSSIELATAADGAGTPNSGGNSSSGYALGNIYH